jgi:serpin B
MEEATASSAGLEALAFRLTERLAADAAAGGGENVVFSPLSIYAVLALAAAGAGCAYTSPAGVHECCSLTR